MNKGKYYSHVQPRLKEIEKMLKSGMQDKEIYTHLDVKRTAWTKYKKEHEELKELYDNKSFIDEKISGTLERLAQIPELATLKESLADDFFKDTTGTQDKIRIINRLYPEDAPYMVLERQKIRNYEREVEVKEKLANHEISGKSEDKPERVVIVRNIEELSGG